MVILGLMTVALLFVAAVISISETDAEKQYEVDRYLFMVKFR
jgi:hypothetical protein